MSPPKWYFQNFLKERFIFQIIARIFVQFKIIPYLCIVNLINHKILITMEKLITKYALANDMEELDILGYDQSTHAFYVLVRLEPSPAQKRAFSSWAKTKEGNYSLQLMHTDVFNPKVTRTFFTELFI